jgi:hypothetical protein
MGDAKLRREICEKEARTRQRNNHTTPTDTKSTQPRREEKGNIKMTKSQQSEERMSMKENHKQIYDLCTSKEQRFKVDTALSTEREDTTERNITEMERFEDTDDNSRQGILSKRSIKILKKKEVRNQQISELRALKNTQKYTLMTSEEQRRTIKIFTTEQENQKEQLYNKIASETAWQTTVSVSSAKYAEIDPSSWGFVSTSTVIPKRDSSSSSAAKVGCFFSAMGASSCCVESASVRTCMVVIILSMDALGGSFDSVSFASFAPFATLAR